MSSRLDQIEARANAATKGPWYRYGTWPYEIYAPREPDGGPYIASVTGNDEHNESNADFIAHARTDVPYLTGQVRRLLDELSAAVADNEKKDAALRAVLELHKPYCPFGDDVPYCGRCEGDQFVRYPCQTVEAIEEALS